MCGIAGELRAQGVVNGHDIAAMCATIAHRGPDSAGLWVDGPIGLGVRRLAIIDLITGDQPLSSEDEACRLVFNGEIYNHRALRRVLEERGHRFRTNSDGEVVVHGYEEYGEGIADRLDGMFAFALWDQRARRLLLARDRAGKKPLFYRPGPRFLFGSEIKAILRHPSADASVDPSVWPEYFLLGYLTGGRTFYRDIVELPPGHTLAVDAHGHERSRRYWALPFPAERPSELPEGEASRLVRDLVVRAVEKRLVSDVPVGAFLSGGIDSSIVVGVMTRLGAGPVRTFSIGFSGDPAFDESAAARTVAGHFGTRHSELIVGPDSAADLEALLGAHDQPYGDSSAIPTFIVSRLAARDVKVVLTGDGGDEVFAGYERFRAALLAERLPMPVRRAVAPLARWMPAGNGHYHWTTRARRFLGALGTGLPWSYLQWQAIFPPEELRELMGGADVSVARRGFEAAFDASRGGESLHRLLHLNFSTYLPGDLLVKLDRTTMANSLEARCPFLDPALIEFVGALPPAYLTRGRQLKRILKRAFADLLPPSILQRPKHGFGAPLAAWFRGPLREYVSDLLLGPTPLLREHLNAELVRRLCTEHLSGQRDHSARLFALLNFEIWLRALRAGSARTGARVTA